jgi:hypothetical protein
MHRAKLEKTKESTGQHFSIIGCMLEQIRRLVFSSFELHQVEKFPTSCCVEADNILKKTKDLCECNIRFIQTARLFCSQCTICITKRHPPSTHHPDFFLNDAGTKLLRL